MPTCSPASSLAVSRGLQLPPPSHAPICWPRHDTCASKTHEDFLVNRLRQAWGPRAAQEVAAYNLSEYYDFIVHNAKRQRHGCTTMCGKTLLWRMGVRACQPVSLSLVLLAPSAADQVAHQTARHLLPGSSRACVAGLGGVLAEAAAPRILQYSTLIPGCRRRPRRSQYDPAFRTTAGSKCCAFACGNSPHKAYKNSEAPLIK